MKIHLSVHLINNGSSEVGTRVGPLVCASVSYDVGGLVCPLHPLEADGAEEEQAVEQNETESQPAVQPPAVQMDTQDLRMDGRRERELHFPFHFMLQYNSENRIKGCWALTDEIEKDEMKIIGKEKQAADVCADFVYSCHNLRNNLIN